MLRTMRQRKQKGKRVQEHEEARPQARASEKEKKVPDGSRPLGALPRARGRESLIVGWTVETPAEWLTLIGQRVRELHHYAASEHLKPYMLWGGLLDLHLLIDAMEVSMLSKIVPSDLRDPNAPPPSRKAIDV